MNVDLNGVEQAFMPAFMPAVLCDKLPGFGSGSVWEKLTH
jgi:hypothetical protein